MEEKRWKWVCPMLQDLVALAQAGSGREICDHFMQQVYDCDGAINAVVESFAPPNWQELNMASKYVRPLEGLPFLVKDNMDVLGFHTVCGNTHYVAQPAAAQDCNMVSTLRELGAIPVGKTNMPTFGLDLQTFNDVYGTTCNPYDIKLTAGGSSGGSAAAVALGLAAFSVGTDWNGSLRIPAAFCGVCSLRASRTRMSIDGRDHVLPPMPKDPEEIGHIMVVGLFTRTVADLEFCMRILLPRSLVNGSDASSSTPLEADERLSFQGKKAQCAVTQSTVPHQSNVTVGVAVTFSGIPLDDQIARAMRKIPSWLRTSHADLCAAKLEAVIVEEFSLELRDIHRAMKVVMHKDIPIHYPVSKGLLSWIRTVRTTVGLICRVWMQVYSESLTPMDSLDWKEHLKDLRWAKGVQARTSHAIDTFLARTGLSALIVPVCPILPPVHNYEHAPVQINGTKVSYWRAMLSFVEPFSVSGNPVVTLPLCWIQGKPCGIQVIGRVGADEELLRTCVALERMIHVGENDE